MTNLLRSELVKVTGARWLWAMSAAVVLAVLAVSALQLGLHTDPVSGSLSWGGVTDRFSTPSEVAALLDLAPLLGLVALVIGAVALPTEFRYQTIAAMYLAVPSRRRILVAKAVVTGVVATVLTVAAQLSVLALVAVWMTLAGADVPLGVETARIMVLSPVAVGVAAVLGVGIGAALRQQVAAVLVVVVWAFAVEQLLAGLVPGIRFALPFTGGILTMAVGGNDDLALGTAAGLSAAYALVALLIGAALLDRRDLA